MWQFGSFNTFGKEGNMQVQRIFLTVNHLDDFSERADYRIGDVLSIKREDDNRQDDEAIAAFNLDGVKCGYVANSVSTVARGTYSAGRLFDKIGAEAHCIIRFATKDALICELFQHVYKPHKHHISVINGE